MFPLRPREVKLPGNKAKNHEAHTSPTKFGMGDHYGTGFKAPVGKMRDSSVGFRPVSKEELGTPPKSLA